MPFTLIQSGSDLEFVDNAGDLTLLTIPSAYTIDPTLFPRMVVFGNFVVVVNSPSAPLTVDATGTVRPLTPKPPQTGPVISAGDSGGLTGTYGRIKYTFIIKDTNGNVISESDFSPASNTVTITNSMLRVDGIETSAEPISARRLYRPTTNGAVLFPWLDLDGNTLTSIEDDLSDANLSLLAAPVLGTPPRLTLIKEWRDLLWGVGDVEIDTLRYSEAGSMWAWPADNSIQVPGSGRDQFGLKALMPRREALGIGRRDLIWQITGQTPDDFRAVKLSELIGVESNESCVVYRDTWWWLWKDGVYQWNQEGLKNISDGKVKSWFNTNNYFNRDMFINSFAVFDPTRLKYRLYLASAGSSAIDRWIEYDIQADTWWGPHKTAAFNPTSSFLLADGDDKMRAIAGSKDAFIWQEQDLATDGVVNGIDFDVITKLYNGNSPEFEKYWGELSMLGKVQAAGTLNITPKTGYTDAPAQTVIAYDMTTGRQRLARLGIGKLASLEFQHSVPGEPVELYGVEMPYTLIGRR